MNIHMTSCPTCNRMGRITTTREDGTLTTATCPNCNGYGVVDSHDEDSCSVCNPVERSSAYPREGEIEAAYQDEAKMVWIMQGKVRKSDPTYWFKAYLIRVDSVTGDASYTTDGVWYTLVKDGRWTFDKSGLSDAAPDDEVEAPTADEDEYDADEDEPTQSWEEAWDELIALGVSEEALTLITSINGTSLETMESVLYSRFGYRSFDQLQGLVMERCSLCQTTPAPYRAVYEPDDWTRKSCADCVTEFLDDGATLIRMESN